MKITLCNITKGDEELDSLKIMVNSFLPYVDYVCITTNGEQIEKTKKFCEKIKAKHTHLQWDKDFSKQRNFNFNTAPSDTDVIIWADTDDQLVGGEFLPHLAKIFHDQEYDAVFLQYWYGCRFNGEPRYENLKEIELHHLRERLLRPGAIVWKKRIHETPVPLDGEKYKYTRVNHTLDHPDKDFPIAILHRGADRNIDDRELMKRQERNREILELELEDERKNGEADPRTILYLMKIYADSNQPELWDKCIFMGEEYLQKSGWDEERGVCLMEMAKCFGKRGSDEAAMKMLHQSIREWPKNPLTYLMLAEAYYNIGLNDKFKFWLKTALNMDFNEGSASMQNILQMKLLSAQLVLRLNYVIERDPDKAYESAQALYTIEPTKETLKTLKEMEKIKKINDACRNVDELIEYYDENNMDNSSISLLQSLPQEITQFPFISRIKNSHLYPKTWDINEICYFANFGGSHFEKWSPKNLDKGIGGSETAVIQLSKYWIKMGYKVTVYGDPEKEGIYDGVSYEPYFHFNSRDSFNIFIQWRSASLRGRVKCKHFFVDLHDMYNGNDYFDVSNIDGVFVKSDYHKNLAPKESHNKFFVISNGI